MAEISSEIPEQTPLIPKRGPHELEISKPLFRRLEIIETDLLTGHSFHGGSKRKSQFQLALWTWFSALLDLLVLVSASCFFIVCFSLVMKASPSLIFATSIKNQSTYVVYGLLFFTFLWSYLVFMRAFIGASVGEWTCDLRLGQPVQRSQTKYILQVMLRTTVVLITGIIFLPLLSLVFKKDLPGAISGLRIYSLQ